MSGFWLRWWHSDRNMCKDLTKTWNVFLLKETFCWTRNGLKHSKFFLASFILSFFSFHWLRPLSFTLNIKCECYMDEHDRVILLEKKKFKDILFCFSEQHLFGHSLRECLMFLHFNQELIMVQEVTFSSFLTSVFSPAVWKLHSLLFSIIYSSLHLLVESSYISGDTVACGSACPIGGCCISPHSVSFSLGAWV